MRTSVKLVSGLAVICVTACSGSQKVDADLARAESLRSELASSGLSSSNAVVSDLEVPPIAKLKAARAGNTADPKGGALGKPAKNGTRKPAETAAPDARVGSTTVPTPNLEVVAPAVAPVAVEVFPVVLPAPVPMEPVSAAEGSGEGGTASGSPRATPRPRPEDPVRPRPGIIIRGGGGTQRDPCEIHRPGGNTGSVLINNRIPTRGGVGGMGGPGAGAARFPGGIR